MPAGALERAVDLLEQLSDEAGELTVAQLAARAGMPTSTAYRLLGELERHGLIARSADSGVVLGTRLVALGRSAETRLRERLVVPAAPVMERLCAQVSETVILTAPCGPEAIVLHVVETEVHSVRLSYALYRRGPMLRGASGKVLAAYLDAAEQGRLLGAVEEPGLREALRRIRAEGVAVTFGELDDGAAGVAAPILDRRGRLLAGLSIAGPIQRISSDLVGATAAVVEAARRIERLERA